MRDWTRILENGNIVRKVDDGTIEWMSRLKLKAVCFQTTLNIK